MNTTIIYNRHESSKADADTDTTCLACGATMAADVTACPKCGWTYQAASTPPANPKARECASLARPAAEISGEQPDGAGPMRISRILFLFEGRIGRSDLWLTSISLGAIHLLVERMLKAAARGGQGVAVAALIVCLVWLVVSVWVSLATQVKRWHDRDKSGWMVLINLIPVVGPLWALVELGFLRGTLGPNRFGDDPIQEMDSPGQLTTQAVIGVGPVAKTQEKL